MRSNEGLGGMSRMLHRVFLDHLIPKIAWAEETPPVLLNTWEAYYFGVNHANVVELAKQASRIGIDVVVLDDGWFGKRNDITSSLGDWTADLTKFPTGIKGLAQDVNAAGCKFGLWVEPEMISEDSQLHALHPDWYLRVPGRPRQIGRNQFVLDLSRREVWYCVVEAPYILHHPRPALTPSTAPNPSNIIYHPLTLPWTTGRSVITCLKQSPPCSRRPTSSTSSGT